jgi:hypothetical protein
VWGTQQTKSTKSETVTQTLGSVRIELGAGRRCKLRRFNPALELIIIIVIIIIIIITVVVGPF